LIVYASGAADAISFFFFFDSRYSVTDSTIPMNTESAAIPLDQTETEMNEPNTDSSNHVQGTSNAGRMNGSWTSLIPGIFRWTSSSPFPRRTTTNSGDTDQNDEDNNMDALD
jgi:hypothetical protein